MTAEQVAMRLVLMCVSAVAVCVMGVIHPVPASGYFWTIGGLMLGYGLSFAHALWRGSR